MSVWEAENLTKHHEPGVRWQALFEEHMKAVANRAEIVNTTSVREGEAFALNVAAMQAHAIAALAFVCASFGSDIELGLRGIADAIRETQQ